MRYFFGYYKSNSLIVAVKYTEDEIGGKFPYLQEVEIHEVMFYGVPLEYLIQTFPFNDSTQLHLKDASAIILHTGKSGEDNGKQAAGTKEAKDQTPPYEPGRETNGG